MSAFSRCFNTDIKFHILIVHFIHCRFCTFAVSAIVILVANVGVMYEKVAENLQYL